MVVRARKSCVQVERASRLLKSLRVGDAAPPSAEVEDVWGLIYAATFNPPDAHPLKGVAYVGRAVEPGESPEALLAEPTVDRMVPFDGDPAPYGR